MLLHLLSETACQQLGQELLILLLSTFLMYRSELLKLLHFREKKKANSPLWLRCRISLRQSAVFWRLSGPER